MLKKILIAALLWPLVALAQSYPSPTFNNLTVQGTFTLSGGVPPASLAAQAANTVLANVTASSASPTAVALPSCSTANSALKYTSASGFSCGTTYALTSATNTFAANQIIAASSANLLINDTSGTGQARVNFSNNSVLEWGLVNQSSSNALGFSRYNAGTLVDSPFLISNSTGIVSMPDGLVAAAGANGTPIGNTTASTGSFTTLSASSTVSGTGFSTYLASPPAIGGTAPGTGKFTTLQATSTITPSSTAGIVGTTTNDNAQAGSVGETVTSNVPRASAISLTTGTPANVTSISLTSGDWDVSGQVILTPNASTTVSQVSGWISTTSATLPTDSDPTKPWFYQVSSFSTGQGIAIPLTRVRISLSATTTVFLSTLSSFGVSTMTGAGFIQARRVR